MKSTPWTASLIMCSTALPPPPPTPITLICVPMLNSSIISIAMCCSNPCSCLESLKPEYVFDVLCKPPAPLSRWVAGRRRAAGSLREPVSSSSRRSRRFPSSEVAEEPVLGPAEHRLHRAGLLRRALAAGARQPRLLEQAHHRRRARVGDHVMEGAAVGRRALPHG